jgi:hypothetical protein
MEIRLALSKSHNLLAYGFENSPRILHPTINNGEAIGQIIERFPDED